MANIDNKAVQHVALLARLKLDQAEIELYGSQLESILQYISKLNQLDTGDTAPTSHPLAGLKNVFRSDVARASLGSEDALANAPSREGDLFKVPKVIEAK